MASQTPCRCIRITNADEVSMILYLWLKLLFVPAEENKNELNEPAVGYGKFSFYESFEAQEAASIRAMALLTPLERLQQMRQLINTAYGMHGYDPNHLPTQHSIKIISGENL